MSTEICYYPHTFCLIVQKSKEKTPHCGAKSNQGKLSDLAIISTRLITVRMIIIRHPRNKIILLGLILLFFLRERYKSITIIAIQTNKTNIFATTIMVYLLDICVMGYCLCILILSFYYNYVNLSKLHHHLIII